mmetsp:Transcript_6805/g.15512  ORF Transcript_6805/g.15512 Transcript_6805/m.15512 type:complete len:1196 (-) Transcript_6805:237-3824(-)
MSYLLIRKGGQRPNKGPASNRNNGNHRRNPPVSSANRRTGGSGGGSQSWRNPSSSSHGGGNSFSRPSASAGSRNGASNNHHNAGANHNGNSGAAVVNDGGGQVQLQRMAPSVQRQQQVANAPQQQNQQNQGQQQQGNVQGMVSMDEVYADLQIVEQQRQESERKLASARLQQKQKVQQKHSLESKLCELKRQNGGMRVELQRASNQLSLRHRGLLEAQSRSADSRKDSNRFDAKLKRAIGVARLLGTYQNQIENAMIALNETETRLNFAKGQETNKLQSATLRRDDAKHRHELLLKAINANIAKGRSIAEEISKIRADIVMNEQDLSAAQQMESQTKLRVETIEHEITVERTRHADAVANLESKSLRELDEAKVKTTQSIESKKAMMETKKAELHRIWEKCTELRKSEGHDVFAEPNWGAEQAPSLDVARVRVRVSGEEVGLNTKKAECETLRKDVTDLDALLGSNTTMAAEKRADAEILQKDAEKARAEESLRKAEIGKAVEEANLECQEVEKLRDSIKDLNASQEKDAIELKLKLDNEESNISAMEANIASTLDELTSIEKQSVEHKELDGAKKEQVSIKICETKKMADIIKGAFERAQKDATDFSVLPDGELVLQMKQLDEAEQDIIEDANREREEMIEMEPLLETMQFDFNSDTSLEDQKDAGMKLLRKHCLEFVESAKTERLVRVEHAREAHLARLKNEEDACRREEEARLVRLKEEDAARHREEDARLTRLKEEACLREEEARRNEEARLLEEEETRRLEEEEEEERRRDEEKAAAAEIERKKNEVRLREERRAELERKMNEEADAERCHQEEEEEEIRQEEERAAAAAAGEIERKKKEARIRQEKRAATKAAALERKKDEEAAARLLQEEEEEEIRQEEEKATAAAADEIERKKEEARTRQGMRSADKAVELERKQDEERFAESQERRRVADEAEKGKRKKEHESRRVRELDRIRVRSKEMQERLKVEEKKHEGKKTGKDKEAQRAADLKRRKERESRKSSLEMIAVDGDDGNKNIKDAAKKRERSSKSYSNVDASKSKSKPTKSNKAHEKRSRDEKAEGADGNNDQKRKRVKSNDTVASSKRESSSGRSKSAIKHKDSKRPKTSSVRFDQTANRPKLDIFSSGVHGKENNVAKKKSSRSSKSSLSKSSGHTSSEGGAGRRRKKSLAGGKSKAKVLAMAGFEDDGGFL